LHCRRRTTDSCPTFPYHWPCCVSPSCPHPLRRTKLFFLAEALVYLLICHIGHFKKRILGIQISRSPTAPGNLPVRTYCLVNERVCYVKHLCLKTQRCKKQFPAPQNSSIFLTVPWIFLLINPHSWACKVVSFQVRRCNCFLGYFFGHSQNCFPSWW